MLLIKGKRIFYHEEFLFKHCFLIENEASSEVNMIKLLAQLNEVQIVVQN